MKVLVTGGSGYIGSCAIEQLLRAGHKVHVFDNFERGHREALPAGVPFTEGDLRDERSIKETVSAVLPDAVMHFAACALVGESMRCPEMYFCNNVKGGINLLEAMRSAGTKQIIFSSTCATYGEPGTEFIDETTPQKPTNPYGESKLIFEKILRWYDELHDFKSIALRYFNACGASGRLGEDHDPETHLIPLILRVPLGQAPEAKIFGDDYNTPDGTCVRDYIHIEDLADAHVRALERGAVGRVNLGTGRGNSVLEVLNACREVTGHDIPATVTPRRPGDPDRLVARADRAAELLGWKPRFTEIKDIVASAWAWHRDHPHGYNS